MRKGQVVGMTGTASRGYTAMYLAHMISLTASRCHIKASHMKLTNSITLSPLAQWLEHPTRSRRVVGSHPRLEFFQVYVSPRI